VAEDSAQRAISPAIVSICTSAAFWIFSLSIRLLITLDADPMPVTDLAILIEFVRRYVIKLSLCRAHNCSVLLEIK